MYAFANSCRPRSSWSAILWSVAGTPWSPNGILQNWKSPIGVANAVLGQCSLHTGTCQYPLVGSRVLMYLALPTSSIISSILGIGYASAVDMAFNLLQSTQSLSDLSSFSLVSEKMPTHSLLAQWFHVSTSHQSPFVQHPWVPGVANMEEVEWQDSCQYQCDVQQALFVLVYHQKTVVNVSSCSLRICECLLSSW